MGIVTVLDPQDFLTGSISRNAFGPHITYPSNPNSCHKKKLLPSNRRRKSRPCPQASSSPSATPTLPLPVSTDVPTCLKKRLSNHPLVVGQVRILKRGEEIIKSITDLESIRCIGPGQGIIMSRSYLSGMTSMPASFYAGPVTLSSPPPSDVPLPGFFAKKRIFMCKGENATSNLIRIPRLEF